MLEEEAARYGLDVNLGGFRAQGSSSSNFFCFGRTPERECYDHFGGRREGILIGSGSRRPSAEEHIGRRDGCWDLVEVNSVDPLGRNSGWTVDQTDFQEGRKEDQLNWEESSVVKFSHFLGFSTGGLEKEILSFLGKIRKRREKIVGKGLLETSRFERELKRLECSVNYEGDTKKKGLTQVNDRPKRKVIKSVIRNQKVDLFCIQETKMQVMSEEVVRSLGPRRFLDWKVLNAMGMAGGVLICWDKRSLEMLGVFTGVYGPFSREDRECLWEEFGAIRGLWEEPWCLGGDFNTTLYQAERSRNGRITSAMRRFAQIIDDLGLVDVPLQGGSFTWSGGLNNQSWARLDRFLATPSWLDQYSRVHQRRLPRPTSDHFPVLLEGGGLRRAEGIETKLKNLEQGGFWKIGEKQSEALQQVERWDLVEEERNLTEEELGHKKEAKENYAKRVNALDKIKINGVRITEEQEVREGIANAYQQLLLENSGWKADIGGLLLKQISLSEAEALELPFSEVEIYAALMGMNGDKASGDFSDQNAFIKGRQILDGSLIANEVMQKMGFGPKWIGWMWSCISTAKYSVLVNGVPAGFFSSSKGLRQGDPLSPYLFVMGMEVLSALITRAVEGGFIYGCRIWRGRGQAVNISHLLFADDTIVFCEAKKESLLYLSWILFWFEAASGLKINLDKSMVIPVGEVEGVLEMAAEIGASSVWDGVEEKVRRRLALWKRQYLSKGGRITLIKSTLASIPLYQMSVFRMPKSVARRLEKLQRDFLWGGANGGNKAHLVKWEVVCVDKEKGGLGLRKLVCLNKALLGKWIWRFARAKEELWKKVLEAKYGQEEFGWRTRKANGVFGVGVWKEILKESAWCWENMVFKVGKGNKIRFWTDPWCGNNVLSQGFPDLFSMAAQRNVTVEEYWDQNLGQGGWNLSRILEGRRGRAV
ncbi:hypothetical protein AAG906_032981 [Vitis piasezkii]